MTYEMYTHEGNEMVAKEVDAVIAAGVAGEFDRDDLPLVVGKMIRAIAKVHPEVRDTEPPWAIADQINARLTSVMQWALLQREDF